MISNPDERVTGPNCDGVSSPAAWSEDNGEDQRLEFAVWNLRGCGGGQGAAADSTTIQWGDFGGGTSPWEDLSNSNALGYGGLRDISASSTVFFQDDQTLTTTRVTTLTETGDFEIRSLGWNGGLTSQSECTENVYPAGANHPFISPVLYQDPWWGDGPDAGANPDDYVYVAREETVNGVREVSIRSYDMWGAGPGVACTNGAIFRYDSVGLQNRKLTMSTPAIGMQMTVKLQVCANVPRDTLKNAWLPDPVDPTNNVPIVDLPSYVGNRPVFPANCQWLWLQIVQGPYLLIATEAENGGNPQLHAFYIDPAALVNGKYPLMWTINLNGVSNNAITMLKDQWVTAPQGFRVQEEAAVVVMDNGQALFLMDLATNPPTQINWNIDATLASPIRSSATQVTHGLVVVPWADKNANPGDLYKMAVVDTVANFNGLKHTMVFNNVGGAAFTLSVANNWVTASGVFEDDTSENDQGRYFYIGVEEPNGANPGAGILYMTYGDIFNNNPGGATYMKWVPPVQDDWQIFATPAIVSTDEANHAHNFLFIVETRPCQQGCGQGAWCEGYLITYLS